MKSNLNTEFEVSSRE